MCSLLQFVENLGENCFINYIVSSIKTHGHVSAVKKAVRHTSVLFTGTTNLPFSTSHISVTTGKISIKFTNFMPLYTQPYIPYWKEIGPVIYEICIHEYCSIIFTFFSSSHCFTKVRHPSHGFISFKFGTSIRHFVTYLSQRFGDV